MATPSGSKRTRLDLRLTEIGAFSSRARARDAILRGGVRVNGRVVTKPGAPVGATDVFDITDDGRAYVSRAALKLIAGLDHFELDAAGCEALDIGASTGGFTQVLLERGAAHVTAIDVGHGQMDTSLAADPRVTSIERINARDLTPELLGERRITALVSDVSFISLKLALPPALELAAPGCFCIALVKPQFEVGRAAVGKGGIVRDSGHATEVACDLRQWLDAQPGWRSLGLRPSPIVGGDGNREYLLAGIKA